MAFVGEECNVRLIVTIVIIYYYFFVQGPNRGNSLCAILKMTNKYLSYRVGYDFFFLFF